MSIVFRSSGNGTTRYPRRARQPHDELRRLLEADVRVPADVEHLADRLGGRRRQAQRPHDVVDVGEVAPLPAVAEDEELLTGEGLPDPEAEEGLPRVPHAHPRPVGVRQPQHRHGQAVHAPVEQVVPLAGGLVDAVHVDRVDRVRLVDREVPRPSVDLARPREHDAEGGVVLPARLEERELRRAVDREIRTRVAHRVEVARLAREVEEDVLVEEVLVQALGVAHVQLVHVDVVLEPRDVGPRPAVVRHERVDDRDGGACGDEPPGEIRPDEPEATRHEHAAPAERGADVVRERRHAPRAWSRRTASATPEASSAPCST